jgi:nucleoside 2-deoxyribosyltransferase
VSVLDPLKRHLLAEKGRGMQPSEETSAATDLLTRLPMLEMRIREPAKDEKRIAELEGKVWRIAVEVQEHARRHHLILAQPQYAMARTHARPKSLFLSGGDELVRIAEALAARHDFELFSRPRLGDCAQERWNQLCSATVAVFDLRVAEGKALAQVCYELGLALALGKPSVVVAHPGQEIPFDVSLQPVSLSGDQAVDQLDQAILDALGSIVWGGAEAGLGQGPRDALAWLDRRFSQRLSEGSLGIARKLVSQNQDDAIAFRRSLNDLLGMLGADAPVPLLPAWPPAYADPKDEPRCFHVMPFSKSWSDQSRAIARDVCTEQGWTYSRGDESQEQRIIRGIWTEIARASAVLVDITGHNANVALELGLVHALGRPYRVVSQDPPEQAKFPSLEKVQIHHYGRTPSFAGFEDIVNELLESEQTT